MIAASLRRTLLVARQEFVKYVTRRGFIISLLLVPLIMGVSVGSSMLTSKQSRTNVMTVVDLAGGYEEAIAQRASRSDDHTALAAIAAYAKKNADMKVLQKTDPDLLHILSAPDRLSSVKAFAARGGWQPVFEKLVLKQDAPAFDPPRRSVILVPAPEELRADFVAGRRETALAYLQGALSVTAAGRASRLNSIVFIPKDYAPGTSHDAQYWSLDSDQSLSLVQNALADAFRLRVNRALVAPALQDRVTLEVDAPVIRIDPLKGRQTDWHDKVAQLVPLGLAFLLFIVAFSDAALLLQGVVEEKSTRMIEVLLSCASPQEIMTGKLIGVVALALVTILGWAVMGLGIASALSTEALPLIVTGFKGILPQAPLVLFYFFCGLMIYCAIFLGIGATSASLADAQALMGPATFIVVLPNMLLSAVIQDPNGTLAQVLSWIPIYTPYFMLVRLPFHPAAIELWATALLTLATTILLVRQMGKVFAAHVLSTERPPHLTVLLRQIFSRSKMG